MYKDLARTAQLTLSVSVIKISHITALHIDVNYKISQKSGKNMEINPVRTEINLNCL